LDSALKATPLGFMEFYEKKAIRLEALDEGYIKINMNNVTTENGSRLTIVFEDSGQGFDVAQLDNINQMDKNKGYSGRGYPLIKNYSESVFYNETGNQIECVFLLEN
jgi:anti-sigma regulatory factor (Ser/Thr protein kinase)